jgi:hypothetical protein
MLFNEDVNIGAQADNIEADELLQILRGDISQANSPISLCSANWDFVDEMNRSDVFSRRSSNHSVNGNTQDLSVSTFYLDTLCALSSRDLAAYNLEDTDTLHSTVSDTPFSLNTAQIPTQRLLNVLQSPMSLLVPPELLKQHRGLENDSASPLQSPASNYIQEYLELNAENHALQEQLNFYSQASSSISQQQLPDISPLDLYLQHPLPSLIVSNEFDSSIIDFSSTHESGSEFLENERNTERGRESSMLKPHSTVYQRNRSLSPSPYKHHATLSAPEEEPRARRHSACQLHIPKEIKVCSDGKKVFQCPYPACLKSTLNFFNVLICIAFTRPFNLKSHYIAEHTEDRPFKCVHCDKTFVRLHDLKRHIKSKHEAAR